MLNLRNLDSPGEWVNGIHTLLWILIALPCPRLMFCCIILEKCCFTCADTRLHTLISYVPLVAANPSLVVVMSSYVCNLLTPRNILGSKLHLQLPPFFTSGHSLQLTEIRSPYVSQRFCPSPPPCSLYTTICIYHQCTSSSCCYLFSSPSPYSPNVH